MRLVMVDLMYISNEGRQRDQNNNVLAYLLNQEGINRFDLKHILDSLLDVLVEPVFVHVVDMSLYEQLCIPFVIKGMCVCLCVFV